MSIQLAIDTLSQYKASVLTKQLEDKYPFEMKRRETYLDNITRQLLHCQQTMSLADIHLIADDIRHCILHRYYPTLAKEKECGSFNFNNTLEDVAQLLELEERLFYAA